MLEAIVIAGGRGSRLQPFTARRPKHLLPVAGIPFLVHQLLKLAESGVDHVVLATSYRAEAFLPTLGRGAPYGLEISYVVEDRPLGTGGAIKNAARSLSGRGDDDEPILVLNGDQLSAHSISRQLARMRDADADACLQVVDVADPQHYGGVVSDEAGRVVRFTEKSPTPVTTQVNAGCYLFRQSIVDEIPPGVVSLERDVFPDLTQRGRRLVTYPEAAYWIDVGTPAALVQASADLVTGVAQSPAYRHPPGERLVDATADVVDIDRIRDGSVIGPGVHIGSGASVEASVVMADADVGPAARIVRSIVGAGARIGSKTVLRKASVGDGAVLGSRCQLAAGVRIGCDERLPDGAMRTAPS